MMDMLIRDFRQAHVSGLGNLLSSTLSPASLPNDPQRLRKLHESSSIHSIQNDLRSWLVGPGNPSVRINKAEANAWIDVYSAYWNTVGEINALEKGRSSWGVVYSEWKEVAQALIKGYTGGNFQSWTIPCLYVVGKYLRSFAIRADEEAKGRQPDTFDPSFQDDITGDINPKEKLEDAARTINRFFTLCISDRAPIEESRKWGLYYTTNLLFKTYFKLNSISLSKNILRALEASMADIPPLSSFPASHVVTFKYYVGVIYFLDENYVKAEEHLTDAWMMCHRDATRNKELILTYLIPCHLLTTHTLPTSELLAPHPRLQKLFAPVCQCIKSGDLAGFDAALEAGEDEFVRRRIYLTLERGRDMALRNLLRKVYLAGGFETSKVKGEAPLRRTRIPVAEFGAALRLGSKTKRVPIDNDEVECQVANMIYKNLVKGYISRERGIVVLSKGNAFPGTGV